MKAVISSFFLLVAPAAAHPPELPARCPAGQAVVGFDAEGKMECQTLGELQTAKSKAVRVEASTALATVDEKGRYTVDAKAFKAMLSQPTNISKLARVVPRMDQGRVIGMALFGIRRGTAADELGLQNGDVIVSVGGHPMTSLPEAMMLSEVFNNAKPDEPIDVKLVRGGVIKVQSYNIK